MAVWAQKIRNTCVALIRIQVDYQQCMLFDAWLTVFLVVTSSIVPSIELSVHTQKEQELLEVPLPNSHQARLWRFKNERQLV